jgi:hypothetical protein
MKRALVAGSLLAAVSLIVGASSALADSSSTNGAVVVRDDAPRGLWCNTAGILTLPGGLMVSPFNAVDLVIVQGQILEATGLVAAANWAPGVGAFCPGTPQVAGKKVTLGGGKVNNLGESIPGDTGAIYNLATVG